MGKLVSFKPDFFLVKLATFLLIKTQVKHLHWEKGFLEGRVVNEGRNQSSALPYFFELQVKTDLPIASIRELGYMDFHLSRIDFWSYFFKRKNVYCAVGTLAPGQDDVLELTASIELDQLIQLQEDLIHGRYDKFGDRVLLQKLCLQGVALNEAKV